jgi:hypothetical protein
MINFLLKFCKIVKKMLVNFEPKQTLEERPSFKKILTKQD